MRTKTRPSMAVAWDRHHAVYDDLERAVAQRDTALIKNIISSDKRLVEDEVVSRITLGAAMRGDSSCVRVLPVTYRMLRDAASIGHTTAIRTLLHSVPGWPIVEGVNDALNAAIERGNEDVVLMLIDELQRRGEAIPQRAMHVACHIADLAIMQVLFDIGLTMDHNDLEMLIRRQAWACVREALRRGVVFGMMGWCDCFCGLVRARQFDLALTVFRQRPADTGEFDIDNEFVLSNVTSVMLIEAGPAWCEEVIGVMQLPLYLVAAIADGGPSWLIRLVGDRTDAVVSNKNTFLRSAVASGREDIVRYLVEDKGIEKCGGVVPLNIVPLNIALRSGHVNLVRYFYERGHVPTRWSLQEACWEASSLETLRRLMDETAWRRLCEEGGEGALKGATWPCARILLQDGVRLTPPVSKASCKRLLDAPPDVALLFLRTHPHMAQRTAMMLQNEAHAIPQILTAMLCKAAAASWSKDAVCKYARVLLRRNLNRRRVPADIAQFLGFLANDMAMDHRMARSGRFLRSMFVEGAHRDQLRVEGKRPRYPATTRIERMSWQVRRRILAMWTGFEDMHVLVKV